MSSDPMKRRQAGSLALRGPEAQIPDNTTILQQILTMTLDRPAQPALISGDRTYSYQALIEAASGVAQHLGGRKVGRGDLVPIVSVGGHTLPIAIVGIMCAGAAFVPIDADWPIDRLRAVVSALSPKVVLCDSASLDRARSITDRPCLSIEPLQTPPSESAAHSPVALAPDDLAYGFFTSGSTGIPKCCLNEHRGLLNRFDYMSRRFGLMPGETVLQNSRHAFDSALWQLLWPLTVGATVVIPERKNILDLGATLDVIKRHRIAMTDFVPSIFNLLVQQLEIHPSAVRSIARMRHLIIGGEEANATMVASFRKLLPNITITNTYGPTEASIGMVFHTVDDSDHASIPLGLPIQNTFAVVVDDALNPVPIGSIGQIAIGGTCLGRGYLNNPEKTAEVWKPNPFDDLPGNNIYLTGDLGHVDPTGKLRFNGRSDFQVKIGGVRIELEEVVSALTTIAGVREAIAMPYERSDGSVVLVAFVVGKTAPAPSAIQDRLKQRLPSASVPGRIVPVDRFPLTPNGKVDRKALTASLRAQEQAGNGNGATAIGVADTTMTDRLIALWQIGLEHGDVTQDTDFFCAGGNSFAAVTMTLKARTIVGHPVRLEDVYRFRTPGALASFLENPSAPPPATNGPTETAQASIEADRDAARRLIETWTLLRWTPGLVHDVFLTGATGYLGAHILDALLTTSSIRVHCLVRAEDPYTARRRLENTLQRYDLSLPDDRNRLVVIPGDLSKARLGIDGSGFDHLAGSVQAIIHAGAEVDFLKGYDGLHETNVGGTIEVLRLAGVGGGIPVHYLSSLSVIPRRGTMVYEADSPDPYALTDDGYSCTKAVSEQLVLDARTAGLPVTIYRIGEAMPSIGSGAHNPLALSHLLIGSMLTLQRAVDLPVTIDYSPVDMVALAIANAVRTTPSIEQTVHLFNPNTVTLLELMRCGGRAPSHLGLTDYGTFHRVLGDRCQNGAPERALVSLYSLLPDPTRLAPRQVAGWFAHMFSDPARTYDRANARALESRLGLTWPVIGAQTVAPFFARVTDALAISHRQTAADLPRPMAGTVAPQV